MQSLYKALDAWWQCLVGYFFVLALLSKLWYAKGTQKLTHYRHWFILCNLLLNQGVTMYNHLLYHGCFTSGTMFNNLSPNIGTTHTSTHNRSGEYTYAGPLEDTGLAAVALQNYEAFYNLPAGTATLADLHSTSAGLRGWATTQLQNAHANEIATVAAVDHQMSYNVE